MASITLSTAPLEYTENGGAIALDPAALFDASGLSASNLNGAELTLSFASGGLASDRLLVLANGSEGISLDGRAIRLNGTVIAALSGGIGTAPLVIRFNSAATLSAVQPLLRSLSYVNLSEALPPTGDRQITVQLQPTGQPSLGPVSRSIAVTGVEDAPVVYSSLPLYSNAAVQLTATEAAPGGPWFAYQDTVTYPSDLPFVGGTPFLGGAANRSLNNGTVLATDNQAYAGFSNRRTNYSQLVNLITASSATVTLEPINPLSPFPVLDRQAGFQLSFSAQISAEARNGDADKNNDGIDDRAGFSLLVVSSDQQAIELGFWQDEIWAQNDGTSQLDPSLEPDTAPPSDFRSLFTHGEGASFNTAQLTDYDLVVKGDRYQLFANNALLLSGALRDYSAFPVPSQVVSTPLGTKTINLPDPYETPNFIFLGDNSPAASATVTLSQIALLQPNANPAIGVSGGVVTSLPQIQIGDPDGLEQTTVILLSVPSGDLVVMGNNEVTVTTTNRGPVLTGTLAAINALLENSQNLSYQPVPGFTGNLPIAIEFEPDLTPPSNGAVSSDFNLDGFSDIVLRNAVSGDNLVRFMDGVNALGDGIIGRQIPDTNWRFDALGDFNNDGKADILLRNYNGSGQILLWTMDGATITNEALLGRLVPDPAWEVAGTGDFDGDGKTDVLLKNYASDENLIWYMDGTQIKSEGLAGRALGDLTWRISATGDFNNDGQTDIVLRHQSPTGLGQSIVWLMNGSQIAEERLIGRAVPDINWEIAGATDFNSDGQSDLLLRNYRTGDNLVWLMNGTSIAQEVPILPVPDSNWRMLV